jgi:hypothetical protein
MKDYKRKEKSEWFLAFVFLGGIILCGSDGDFFPLPNLLGFSLLGVFSLTKGAKAVHHHEETPLCSVEVDSVS